MKPKINQFKVKLEANPQEHSISYTEWGQGDKLLVCVHGLTRNGRDFDFLAHALADNYRVICPDMPGRGKSGWLDNYLFYNNVYYVDAVHELIKSLGHNQVDWVGTSMGGLMGMIAAAKFPNLIRKMVLNDIGPYISAEGMRRIATYIKDEVKFPSEESARKRFKEIFEPFKIEHEHQWDHLLEHGIRKVVSSRHPEFISGSSDEMLKQVQHDGSYWSFNHDPKLGAAFKDKDGNVITMQEFDLWRIWDAIKSPTLVLRGELSDILSREVAEKMAEKAKLVEFAGYGHVPPLMNNEQIGVVKSWLLDS